MTYEEAKQELEASTLYLPTGTRVKALKIAIEAMEKVDKHRWHDLRKNPNDLPIYEKPYWCVIETMGKTIYEPKTNKEYRVLGRYQILNLKEFVIAWKEIDPFEVVE